MKPSYPLLRAIVGGTTLPDDQHDELVNLLAERDWLIRQLDGVCFALNLPLSDFLPPKPASISAVQRACKIARDYRREKTTADRFPAFDRPEDNAVRTPFDLTELPDDLAEAFESFKLGILRHNADGWRQIDRYEAVEIIEVLAELARSSEPTEPPC